MTARLAIAILLLAATSVGQAVAQRALRFKDVKPRTCPEADSLLGELGKDEAHVRLHALYLSARDTTLWTTAPRLSSTRESGFHLSVQHAGRVAGWVPGAQLVVFFPSNVLESVNEDHPPSLWLLLDDSVRLDLGPPKGPIVDRGQPDALPLSASLTPQSFLALARARTASASYRDHPVRVRPREIQAARALVRVLVCAVEPS
jgi:hypothetical protein